MEAKDKKLIQQEILLKDAGTDPEMDIDWDMMEISFKAGHDSRKSEIEELMDYAFKDGERIGIREVLDWGDEPCLHKNTSYFARDCPICLEAKLKEWGLK